MMMGKPAAIINTASRAGKVPPIFNSAYAVAKGGHHVDHVFNRGQETM
jgi:NAD(P)-dependent dehydrogenase (short-subunit alcohol dehydrogenase family)